jgi:HAD superfamily hydrolase (TIGR01490 family)
MDDPLAAAFFDLDKTLMQGSSAFQFGRAAYRAGQLSRRQLARDAWANIRYRLRGATDDVSTALRDRIARDLTGVPVKQLERLAPDVLAGILPRIYPQMLQVAYAHQDAGRRAYIVTAASQELAELLAEVLRFDGAIGSQISEIRDGIYTGRPTGEFVYRAGKARAIAKLAEREGIDLRECYAYSDSESDMPMLELVGHPVVVNPDAALLDIARERGWQVMRLDPLGRRLKALATLAAAAAAGGIGAATVAARAAARQRSRDAATIAARAGARRRRRAITTTRSRRPAYRAGGPTRAVGWSRARARAA